MYQYCYSKLGAIYAKGLFRLVINLTEILAGLMKISRSVLYTKFVNGTIFVVQSTLYLVR